MIDFTIHDETTAPEQSQELLAIAMKQYGFIPNLRGIMAEAPGLFIGYQEIHKQFMKSSFNRTELTVIWQAANVENNCHYCVPAHTLMANNMKVDPEVTKALRNETPLEDPKLETLRDFTLSVMRGHGVVDEEKVQAFFDAGYTKQNVLEVILGIAQKVMSNYTNHFAETPLDDLIVPYAWEKKS